MDKRPINEMMETAMLKVKEIIDVNSVVGEPIVVADGVTLIPVSMVSVGFVGGGVDASKKQEAGGNNSLGGGIGTGIKVEPVAFVVVKENDVKILFISHPEVTTIDRIIDMAPGVIDKVSDFIKKDKD